MAEQLFPIWEIPEESDEAKETREKYFWPGPLFDFEIGDFALNGKHEILMVDGYDAYMLWCVKCTYTQLGACAAYPDFGIDFETAIKQTTHEAVESVLEESIIDALMTNPRTEDVHTFQFEWKGDELYCSFIVEPQDLEAFDIRMRIVT